MGKFSTGDLTERIIMPSSTTSNFNATSTLNLVVRGVPPLKHGISYSDYM